MNNDTKTFIRGLIKNSCDILSSMGLDLKIISVDSLSELSAKPVKQNIQRPKH